MPDLSPSFSTWPKRGLVLLVRGYRLLLSPMLRDSCRYDPTCSGYALQALEQHGAAAGSYLAARRLLRCHPFCRGGLDPVPQHLPGLFTRFTPAGDPLLRNDAQQPPSPSIPQSPR